MFHSKIGFYLLNQLEMNIHQIILIISSLLFIISYISGYRPIEMCGKNVKLNFRILIKLCGCMYVCMYVCMSGFFHILSTWPNDIRGPCGLKAS